MFMTDKNTFWQELKLGRFVSMVKESEKGRTVSNSKEVYHVLKPLFAQEDDVEKVYFIFMDAQNRIISIENLFTGSIITATIHSRELIKRILKLGASAFVMAHNHPSGDIKPSPEDKSISVKVGIATASIDVAFHDHVIIREGYHSMADTGWLKTVIDRFNNAISPSEPDTTLNS
jgi:DNA repair protein RadC